MPKSNGKHPGGRPTKYETVILEDLATLKSTDFRKEIDLVNYLFNNIDLFVSDLYGDEVVDCYKEKPIDPYMGAVGYKGASRGNRIDLYVRGSSHNYIIEVKNPKYRGENIPAIGQLLNYGRKCGMDTHKLIFVSSHFDIDTANTIEAFELPIKYVYLDKVKQAVFVGTQKERSDDKD